jgi:hypothetical protein
MMAAQVLALLRLDTHVQELLVEPHLVHQYAEMEEICLVKIVMMEIQLRLLGEKAA